MLRWIFACQNSAEEVGARLQRGQPCQKQPSTNNATFAGADGGWPTLCTYLTRADTIPIADAPSFRVLCERVGVTDLNCIPERKRYTSEVPSLGKDARMGHPQSRWSSDIHRCATQVRR